MFICGYYLDLGAVVCFLCGQQAREAVQLVWLRLLVLLLAGPVTVHVTRFWGEPSPPAVTVQPHVHCCILVSCLPQHIRVGDP